MRNSIKLLSLLAFLAATAGASAQTVRVACVGDSITYGATLKDRAANNYPAQLGRWLGTGYTVRNFGLNATTMLHQGDLPYFKQPIYSAALEFKPDLLVINLGANDSKHPGDGSLNATDAVNNWQYSTNFVADYKELIAAFQKANPAVKPVRALPTPDYPGSWGINERTIREEMTPMLRTVAKDTGATLIDLHAALAGKPELFPDTVHPNDAGAKLMAAEVYRVLTGHQASGVSDGAAKLLLDRRVLWLGDSITQDGNFVSFVEYYLDRDFPQAKLDIVSIGLGSETVSRLTEKSHPFPRPCVFERLQRALDAVKPTMVVACYGMNDGIYHPQRPEYLKAFQDGIHRLSAMVHAAGAELILLTPPPFDAPASRSVRPESASDFGFDHPFAGYDSVLGDYSAWEKSLPASEARLVVDLHSALNGAITGLRRQNPQYKFTGDGVHPQLFGHLLMAQAILHALGMEVSGGDAETDLKAIRADPLYQLVRQQREKRSAGWLDFVGYTRDKTVKTASVDETEKAVAGLQVKIDDQRRAMAQAAK